MSAPAPAMTYGRVGPLDGFSRVVFGTARILRTAFARGGRRAVEALLDGVVDSGCTAIDTAPTYDQGDVERALGDWVASRAARRRVFIVTKVGHARGDLTPERITSSLEASLRRLRIDAIDLCLAHHDAPDARPAEIADALAACVRAGTIRCYGVSNWADRRLGEMARHAEANGLPAPIVTSPQYGLGRWSEPPWPDCTTLGGPDADERGASFARSGVSVFAWSALCGGFFGTADGSAASGAPRSSAARVFATEDNARRRARATELAAERGCTTARIALAYVLSAPFAPFAVVSAGDLVRWRDNVGACAIHLTDSERAWLDLRR